MGGIDNFSKQDISKKRSTESSGQSKQKRSSGSWLPFHCQHGCTSGSLSEHEIF